MDASRGNWSEGLTTYLADHLYKEHASPREGRDYRSKLLRDYATLVPPAKDFPLAAFSARFDPASRAIGYGKAAMVFHMARRRVGDGAFRTALRRLAGEKFGAEISWEDFARALSAESGIDMEPHFRQWATRPGAPILALEDVTAAPDAGRGGWTVSGRIVQREPYFDLHVPVRVVAAGKQADAVVPLSGRAATFSIRVGSRPVRLEVDPDVDLFRRLDPSEIPPDVNAIKGSGSVAVVAARGLAPETLEACRPFLEALGLGRAPILREEDAPAASLSERDVLYLGAPEGSRRFPPLPEGLSFSPRRFTAGGKVYDSPGDALFAALPHPSGGGRVVALFLPLSPAAARAAGRKVAHYGPYGWLAFSDGVNRGKGTWPPAASPLARDFGPLQPSQLPVDADDLPGDPKPGGAP